MTSSPTAAFARADLDIATVPAGEVYRRIYLARHPDALGFGKTPSRFSDPRRRIEARRFGILYLGSSLKVCFLEAILRDQRDGVIGVYLLAESDLVARATAEIVPTRALRLIDLRGDGQVRMGVPSDVARGTRQTVARDWSVAFHDHPAQVDGILYSSRLNGEHNIAIYDRAVPALACTGTVALLRARGLATIIRDLKLAIV